MKKYLADFTPLKNNANFRRLFFGQWISNMGSGVSQIAFPFQMHQMTHDNRLVGLIGLANLIPTAGSAIFGGWAADRFNRKKIAIGSEIAYAAILFCVAFLTFQNRMTPASLFIFSALSGFVSGFHRPALEALTPQILKPGEMAAASALAGFRGTFSMIVGPSIGGVLAAYSGIGVTYLVDGISFIVSVLFLVFVRVPHFGSAASQKVSASLLDRLRYARKQPVLLGTYFVDIACMVFTFPLMLFPALGILYGSSGFVGLLHSSAGLGAFVASVASGWIHREKRHGRVVTFAALGWSLGILILGYSGNLYWAMGALFFAGFSDMVSGIFRQTIWNETIPTEVRGRLAAIEMLSYLTGPLMGASLLGFAAEAWGVQNALKIGSGTSLVGILILGFGNRKFYRYQAQ